jgi:predicted flavoprotein YhiN
VTGEAGRRERPVGPMVRISAGQVGRPSPARATTSDRVLPRALVTRAGRGLAARVATSAFMATRAPRVPDHAHDVARQRLVQELGQLELSLCAGGVFAEDSSTAGGVQRVDLTGRILPAVETRAYPRR